MKNLSRKLLRRAAGMPGVIDASVAVADMLGRPPKIDTSWRHIDKWMSSENTARDNGTLEATRGQHILFFAIYPHWIDYSMAIAALLCRRGVAVDFRWMGAMTPLAGQPVPVRERFWKRHSTRKANDGKFGRLGLSSLDRAEMAEANEIMRKCATDQAVIDVSYLLKKERVDIANNAADRATFDERIERNLRAIRLVAAAFKRHPYTRLLLGNGGVLEFGAVYRYFQALNIPVTTFESVDIKSRIWIAHHESVVRADTSALWQADEPHAMTPDRQERVQAIIRARQTPSAGTFVIPYQKSLPTTAETVRRELRLDNLRPVVLICPNVPFDAVFYSGGRQMFSGMWEWFVESCRTLAGRDDCQIVVRCHPAEPYFDTRETARALLSEYLPDIPSNMHIVAPTNSISTYSLMDITDVGVVFASTTGLEMAMRGVPVVCGNPSQHYNRKGFTIDTESRTQFFDAIDRIIKDPKSGRLTTRQIELSHCYADLYFNNWYRQFPWQSQSLWADMREWPIDRILSDEGERKFGPVLDELLYGRAGARRSGS